MSDELKIEIDEPEVIVEAAGDKEVTLSSTETKAVEQGWKPKEEWVADGGDPDEWRSAKEFVDRGDLLKQIHNQNRKFKQIESSFTALKQHHGAVYEKAYKDAVAALKSARRAAMVDGDIERVEMIEDKIEETQAEFNENKAKLEAEQASNKPNPQFVEWVDQNTWYEENEDLREFADVLGVAYARKHPGISPDKVLKHVETEVKKKFPEETGTRKAAPNPVSRVDKSSGRKAAGGTQYQLTETETEIMKNFVRTGVMTKEQYIAELKKVNERN